jgi:hypothetical protein
MPRAQGYTGIRSLGQVLPLIRTDSWSRTDHGQFHGAQYARDIERIGRLRAAGWIVIQVSSTLVFGDLPSVLSACGRNSSTRGDVADSSARCVRMMSDQKTSQGA